MPARASLDVGFFHHSASQLSTRAAALPLAPHRLVVGAQEGEGAGVLVQIVRIALVLACSTESECK